MSDLPQPSAEALNALVRRLRTQVARGVATELAGAYASAVRGVGTEFEEFVPYRPGDDVRRIDWAVSSRRRRPYMKRFLEERRLRVLVALDISPSMGDLRPGTPRRRAAEAAALLVLSAARNGDRCGALLWCDGPPVAVPPVGGENHALRVVRDCLSRRVDTDRTDLRPLLVALRDLRRPAVVLLVSDFLVQPPVQSPPVRRLLEACARRHRLMALHVPASMPAVDPGTVLEGREPESGRRLLLQTRRPASVEHSPDADGAAPEATLRRCGVALQRLPTGADAVRAVHSLLVQGRPRRPFG